MKGSGDAPPRGSWRLNPAGDGAPAVFDSGSGEVTCAGAHGRLGPQPARVLALLIRRSGEVVTRDELFREVWGNTVHVDHDQGLNACVRDVRAVLGDDARRPRFIETLPRRGYRLLATVDESSRAEKQAGVSWLWRRGFAIAASVAVTAGLLLATVARESVERIGAGASAATDVAVDSEAWRASPGRDAYLRGRYLATRPDSVERAADELRAAVAADPELAPAWEALAGVAFDLAIRPGEPPVAGLARAEAMARRALELDDTLPQAHFHLGRARLYRYLDWSLAAPSLARAAELAPADARLRLWLGWALAAAGRHSAAAAAVRAARDADPESSFAMIDEGWVHYFGDDPDTAARVCGASLALEPSYAAVRCLQAAMARRGDQTAAAAAAKRLLAVAGLTDEALGAGEEVLADQGPEAYLAWVAATLEAACPVGSLTLDSAVLYAQAGDLERARERLRDGLDQRLYWAPFAALDPYLAPLRPALATGS